LSGSTRNVIAGPIVTGHNAALTNAFLTLDTVAVYFRHVSWSPQRSNDANTHTIHFKAPPNSTTDNRGATVRVPYAYV